MQNTKAFYKLYTERQRLEDLLIEYDKEINLLKNEIRKCKKGSTEKESLMKKMDELRNNERYISVKVQIKTMNFCINTVFY